MIIAYAEADDSLEDYHLHANLLSKRVKKLYKKRHEVAHFLTVGRGEPGKSPVLIRPFFTWSKFLSNERAELNSKQLSEKAQKFRELSHRIQRYVQHVGALRKLPLEYYVQAGDFASQPLGPKDLILPTLAPPPSPSEE